MLHQTFALCRGSKLIIIIIFVFVFDRATKANSAGKQITVCFLVSLTSSLPLKPLIPSAWRYVTYPSDWILEISSTADDLLQYMEVFDKICSELEAARKEITRLDLDNQAKQTKIYELSAENTRSMNMWQFEKNLVHEFVKEAEIIDLKETVSKQEIRELENDLVTKNEELILIRGRESEGLQKIKELKQVVKTLRMQKTRLVDTELKHRA